MMWGMEKCETFNDAAKDEGYRLYIAVSHEKLSLRQFKTGHVGFSVETPSKERTYFDFGMAAAIKERGGECSKLFSHLSLTVPLATIAVYSAMGIATASAVIGNPFGIIVGAYMGAAYATAISPSVGVLLEGDKPAIEADEEIEIPITKRQYEAVIDYTHKHKKGIYSLSLASCAIYTRNIMKACGIDLPKGRANILPSMLGKNAKTVRDNVLKRTERNAVMA